ncbi:MAG: dihydroorotase family protein [Firmicutes bacterium]|nr:dihydroorotase family protein [Bacillota bacterium]
MRDDNQPLLLKNAEYYTPQGFKLGHLLLDNGRIAEIWPNLPSDEEIAARYPNFAVYDVADKLVLPGAVDTHVHVREPGSPQKEDFISGTAAALSGGVTTICQMPNVLPLPHNAENLAVSRQAAEKALCNVCIYASAGADNQADFAELAGQGVCGLKTFLQPSYAKEPQYLTINNAASAADDELTSLLAAAVPTGLRCFFHCEDYGLIAELEAEAHSKGEEAYDFHYKTRRDEVEINAVKRVLTAAKKTGAKVGIVHVSTVGAAKLIAAAKAEGVDVTFEVCFHHLFFDDSWLDKFGPYAKCNPPLRSADNVQGLWQYINDGTVDYLGSDHAPHLLSEKQRGEQQIWLAPSGIGHIELMLPLLLTAVKQGKLTVERLTELLCVNGYKMLGLYPQKGCIAVGADADLTVVDLRKDWQFDSKLMQTKARESCRHLDGLPLNGAVEAAVVRGRLLYAAGKVDYQSAGWGGMINCRR